MNEKRGLLFVFFTALISGFSIFVNKFGVSGINSSVFTFAKNMVVALVLFSVIMLFKEFKYLKELNKKQWGKLVCIGLFGGSIPFLLFFKGLSITSGAMAAFIHKTMFIFVAVFAFVFLKEKLNKGILIGGALLIAGNLFLLRLKFVSFNIGDLLILIATLLWAVEFTISKNALKDIGSNVVAFGRMGMGSLFILLFLAFSGGVAEIGSLSLMQIAWIMITSIFLFFFVFTWYSGLKYVKVSTATCVLLLGSPITTMLSFAFLGAPLTIMQGLGMLLIVGGVGIVISYVYIAAKIKKVFQLHTHNE
ncbi:MAG: DMT family transporter [Candidatus Woesearchaeota archaeon]